MGCKEKEKLCKKGPLEGEREGHRCRVGARGVWAQGHGSLAGEGEKDSGVRKARIHPFEFCFKLII